MSYKTINVINKLNELTQEQGEHEKYLDNILKNLNNIA